MVLKAIVKVSKSRKASTQYISIPADVVKDSQYPFADVEELELIVKTDEDEIILRRPKNVEAR